MDLPKLKLPPKGFTVDDSYDSAGQQGTLAQIVMDTIIEQNKKLTVPYTSGDSNRQRNEKACKAFNESFQKTRELIDTRVQEYLLSHGGEAGSWPDSTSLDSIEWAQQSILEFDYFGDEYEALEQYGISFLQRKSENFVYRNTYKAPDSPEYAEIKKEENKLFNTVSGKWGFWDVVVLLGSLLLMLLGGFVCFAFVAEIVSGGFADHTLHPLLAEWAAKPGIGWIQVVLEKLFSFLLTPADQVAHGTAVDFFGMIFFVAVALVVAGGSGLVFWGTLIRRSAWKNLKKLLKSKRYQEAKAKNEAYRKALQDLSDEWHKAWFRWVQIHKGGVGVTRVNRLMERSRAMDLPDQEKKMRQQVRDDLGLRIPDETNALLWWKLFDRRTDTLVPEYAENGETSFDELSNSARTRLVEQVVQEMVEERLAEYIE